MESRRNRELISILMESPLYTTLSVQERRSLLTRLVESYPVLSEGVEEEYQIGYESSWAGITGKP
ncbi:MAG: hypothetical protein P8Z71_05555 [Candidatus Sulfobium sp.]|jgi:hypothetical protein